MTPPVAHLQNETGLPARGHKQLVMHFGVTRVTTHLTRTVKHAKLDCVHFRAQFKNRISHPS